MISPELDTRVLAAGRTLGMSFSVMSILDDTRQVVRAGSPEWLGFTPRESSFCHHTIASPDGILVVEDATLDGRFASKPAVTRPGGLRFYAGACVHSPDGHRLGTLCVLDPQPGRFGAAERDLLKKMSGELDPLLAEHARDEADDLCTALARHGRIIIEARFESGSLVLRDVKGGLIPSASGADLADMPVSDALGLRRNAALSELERCAGEASAWFGELEGRRLDGQPFWWEAQLLLSPGGRLRLVCRDVSERVLKLRQSRAAEALLAQVFFTSAAATAMIRVDGRIELVDPSFGRLVGQKPEELAGRPGLDVIAPEDRPLLADARDPQFAHGEPFTIDLAMLHASGTTTPVRYHSEVTRKAGTAPLRVVTISPVAPAGSAPVGSAPAATPRIEVAGRIQLAHPAGGPRCRQGGAGRQMGDARGADASRRRSRHPQPSRQGRQLRPERRRRLPDLLRIMQRSRSLAARLRDRPRNPAPADRRGREVRAVRGQRADRQAAQEQRRRGAVGRSARAVVRHADGRYRGRSPRRAGRRHRQGGLRVHPRATQRGRGRTAGRVRPADEGTTGERPDASAAQRTRSRRGDALRLRLVVLGMLSGTSKVPILLDVGASVFTNRARTERFTALASKINQGLRERLVMLLSMQPRDVPDIRMRECLQRIKPFCRDIAFRCSRPDFPPSMAPKGTMIAMEYDDLAIVGPDVEAITRKYVASLAARGSRLLVTDVPDDATAQMLSASGVELLAMGSER